MTTSRREHWRGLLIADWMQMITDDHLGTKPEGLSDGHYDDEILEALFSMKELNIKTQSKDKDDKARVMRGLLAQIAVCEIQGARGAKCC